MKMYSNWAPALRRLCDALLCIAASELLVKYANPSIKLGKPGFSEASIWDKWTYLFIKTLIALFRSFAFYAAQEVIMIATGMGYKPRTDKAPEQFNAIRAIDISGYLFAQNPADAISSWNMTT